MSSSSNIDLKFFNVIFNSIMHNYTYVFFMKNKKLFVKIQETMQLKIADFFGLAKNWKIDSQEFKDNLRKSELENSKKIFEFLHNP